MYSIGRRQIHIEAKPQNHQRWATRLAAHINEQTGELGVVTQNVVWPLEARTRHTEFFQRAHHGHAGGQAQARKTGGAGFEAPVHGHQNIVVRGRYPTSPAPPTPGRLRLGQTDAPVVGLRRAQKMLVGGIHLLKNFEIGLHLALL